jgi:hypothetical protein
MWRCGPSSKSASVDAAESSAVTRCEGSDEPDTARSRSGTSRSAERAAPSQPPGSRTCRLPGRYRAAPWRPPSHGSCTNFEPKSWEDFQIAFAQAHARGDEEARELLAEKLARDPNAWQPAYHAACFEALTENADAAFEHLARAFALGPERVRKLAANGEDFAALRSDPRWQQLMDL